MKGVLRRIVESKTLEDFTKVQVVRGYRERLLIENEAEKLNLISQLKNLKKSGEIFLPYIHDQKVLPYMEELKLPNFKELEDE